MAGHGSEHKPDPPELVEICLSCTRETCRGDRERYLRAQRAWLAQHRRRDKLYEYQGEWRTRTEWARLLGLKPSALCREMRKGMTLEEAANRRIRRSPNTKHTVGREKPDREGVG